MKLLSIDVGIKNLAYCLFNINDTLEIDKWDIANLCGEISHKCDEPKKNCKRTTRYHKNGQYFCKIHAKKKEFKILKDRPIEKMRLHELKEFCKINHKISKKDCLELATNIFEKEYFNTVQIIKTTNLNMVDIGRNLKQFLDTLLSTITIDTIIIESQIGPIANRMKTLEGMIIQYFIGKNCKNIELVSSSNKLKPFIDAKEKTSYNQRKKMGIDITYKLLNNHFVSWEERFNSHKKKDDLADSFLQGLSYLKTNFASYLKL